VTGSGGASPDVCTALLVDRCQSRENRPDFFTETDALEYGVRAIESKVQRIHAYIFATAFTQRKTFTIVFSSFLRYTIVLLPQ
jgi:hypothetical protein